MGFHFDLVGKLNARLQKGPLSKETKADRQLLINVLLHTCDLSNAMKPWELTKFWSDLVQNEFLQQVMMIVENINKISVCCDAYN